MDKKWDFWSSEKMSYDDRTRVGSGDSYGIGQPPKIGKMRASYMDDVPNKKELLSPPTKVA